MRKLLVSVLALVIIVCSCYEQARAETPLAITRTASTLISGGNSWRKIEFTLPNVAAGSTQASPVELTVTGNHGKLITGYYLNCASTDMDFIISDKSQKITVPPYSSSTLLYKTAKDLSARGYGEMSLAIPCYLTPTERYTTFDDYNGGSPLYMFFKNDSGTASGTIYGYITFQD